MQRYLDSRAEPEPPDDVNFEPYSVDTMFQTGSLFIEHGILPEAGGWFDQPADWTDALHKWLALRAYVAWQRKHGGGLDDLINGGAASSIEDLFKD